ncbi:MAG: CinA family nicotinamide mononucleotide deamidase-related protein [Candidatus Cloacimonetes bacterium]|nr:CinA family nicotinamide mononucleotide deamidase-related protein [Candidatus Cloacimonadota bacterium]
MINKIFIINIGNELLTGRITNTNLTTLGQKLLSLGFEITEAYVIPDVKDAIFETLNKVWLDSALIIVTGGLGPTKDDITRTTLGEFFKKEMIFYEDINEDIRESFRKRNSEMPEINRVQAYIPQDFMPLKNKHGTAPGMYYKCDNRHLISLPGVPFEMEHLFEEYVVDILEANKPEMEFWVYDINTYGIGESAAAEIIENISLAENVKLAWLPHLGRVDLRLMGCNKEGIMKALGYIEEKLSNYIWGKNEKNPIDKLHQELINRQMTIATVESCTGGMLSSLLTTKSGSSKYMMGSVVCYSNDVKINTLGVLSETINKYGAVSLEVAHEMLEGCKKMFNTDICCAITGIAGPEGGSKEKPVGTVYIGVSILNKKRVEKCYFIGNREQIRQKAVDKAVFMVLEEI